MVGVWWILLFTISLNAFTLTQDVEVLKIDNVGYSWKSVNFNNSYSASPIVVCTHQLLSKNDPDVVVRIDNLSPTSFQIKLQQPRNTNAGIARRVYCMVAKEGVNTLENGYTFEARKVTSKDTSGINANGWEGTGEIVKKSGIANLVTGTYSPYPVVIGQVMSYNDPNFSVFWSYDCIDDDNPPTTNNICVGKHIGRDDYASNTIGLTRQTETLGVIVIERKVTGGAVNGVNFTANLGGNSIKGVDNRGNQSSYTLGGTYSLGVATQSAMNGGDGSWAVLYGSNPIGSTFQLAVDEDTISDTERGHIPEQVAYLLFDADPAQHGLGWIEAQKIPDVGYNWKTVSFTNTYTNPVPVCVYNLPSTTENEAVVRIDNLTSTSMQVKIQRPRDRRTVTPSDVYCIIMEEGSNTLGGVPIEARRVNSDQTNRSGDWSSTKMEHINYLNSYTHPVVLGQVITYNDSRFSTFWASNGGQTNPPTKNALYIGKHIGQDNGKKFRKDEVLGFIVGSEHSAYLNNVYYALERGDRTIRGINNQPPYNYTLARHYSYSVATQIAQFGDDGGWAVFFGSVPVDDKIHLAIDEAPLTSDRKHYPENVAYWVFDPYPELNLTKTSCVIKDPVNSTTNPKRIPGATIRYALEVKNSGKREAENVIVIDKLQSDFDSTTIQYLQVQSGECNCTGVSSANNNGANGGVSGNTVTLDYGTVAAGTPANPTYECGYFEVEIK